MIHPGNACVAHWSNVLHHLLCPLTHHEIDEVMMQFCFTGQKQVGYSAAQQTVGLKASLHAVMCALNLLYTGNML
jgi:hypothetical protein